MPSAKHNPMRRAVATTRTVTTTTPMERSIGSKRQTSSLLQHSFASSSSSTSLSSTMEVDSSVVSLVRIQEQIPVPRPDEPNLFEIPTSLHPIYRPLPTLAKVASTIFSIFVAAASTWPDRTNVSWLQPLLSFRTNRLRSFQKVLEFALKCAVTGLVTNLVTQEVFLSPSRISTAQLAANYHLPSALSRYEPLPVILPNAGNLSIHWLEYHPKPESSSSLNATNFPFAALYVNHGFGASSLSWLPALPALVDQLGARVGLGHDAPGFGFTDRPDDIRSFTPQSSSNIASRLLQSQLDLQQHDQADSVILFGHSMGSITTLFMALSLPEEIQKQIVLVAPALGVSPQSNRIIQVQFPKWSQPAIRLIGKVIVDPPASFLLKRLVGSKNFWKHGLRTVWGKPSLVSDSDVLRFQWPSIGLGWEKGLLSFTRAQFSVKSDFTDRQLLEKVLAMPNTRVIVILGIADRVIPANAVRKFFKPYTDVAIVELEGQGHDPFEEDVEMFVQTVKKVLQSENKPSGGVLEEASRFP